MSERYGDCKLCKGLGGIMDQILLRLDECPRCGGTGFSGDVKDYQQIQNAFEPEQTETRDFRDIR